MFIILAAYSLEVEKITGTTPPAVPCPDSLCKGKSDGNFEYHYYDQYRANYFLQCSGGMAYCQPCFPLSLEFSEGCNQCLYTKYGKNTHTLKKWFFKFNYKNIVLILDKYTQNLIWYDILFTDNCVTTQPWKPATTLKCPDLCPSRGPEFDGNLLDPVNVNQYVACWRGTTVGCIACPKGLEFNEKWNACLYDGIYKTQPSR